MLFFNLIIPLPLHNYYLGALIQFSHGYGHKMYTSFWIHHFCSSIILNFLMFLKCSHIYFRGCLIIHQMNEWVLIMCLSGDLKVFPILATASDKLYLLKWKPIDALSLFINLYIARCSENVGSWRLLVSQIFHYCQSHFSFNPERWVCSICSPIFMNKKQVGYLLPWSLVFLPAPRSTIHWSTAHSVEARNWNGGCEWLFLVPMWDRLQVRKLEQKRPTATQS